MWAALGVIAGLTLFTASATGGLITFETSPPTVTTESPGVNGPVADRVGAITSLALSVAGVDVTITRAAGAAFDLTDNTLVSQTGKDAEWGGVSLETFADKSLNPLIFSFSSPVKVFSIAAGDYAVDPAEDDGVLLTAYADENAQGAVVTQVGPTIIEDTSDETSEIWFDERVSIGDAAGFRSVAILAGNVDNRYSLFFDRAFFDLGSTTPPPVNPETGESPLDDPNVPGEDLSQIPEPASVMVLLTGMGLIATGRKR